MWKSKVRYFLVWSSGPYVLPIYRRMYRLIIGTAVMMFRQCRGIRAVYLTRGCSKQEITPGISDIDFILIVNDDATERMRAEQAFHTLQILTAGLIPYHPVFVLSEGELQYKWRSTPLWRYRLQEGKSNWLLAHGVDALAALPAIPAMELNASCWAEMNYWWVQFCDGILQNDIARRDPILRNSICYKAVAEVMNARHALDTGEFCYSKDDALRRDGSGLSRKLLKTAASRFLESDRELEEESYRFLMKTFIEVWGRFGEHPFLEVHAGIDQEVDAADDDLEKEKRDGAFLAISKHLSQRWGEKLRGVHLVKSAFWKMEDSLLVIDVEPDDAPTLKELEELIAVRKRVYSGQGHAVHLFVRVNQTAFPITPVLPGDYHRGVLTPATAPDVFLQLGEKPVYWTNHATWYLTDWRQNRQWPDASPMKQQQLEMIASSAAAGLVRYTLSVSSRAEPSSQRVT